MRCDNELRTPGRQCSTMGPGRSSSLPVRNGLEIRRYGGIDTNSVLEREGFLVSSFICSWQLSAVAMMGVLSRLVVWDSVGRCNNSVKLLVPQSTKLKEYCNRR